MDAAFYFHLAGVAACGVVMPLGLYHALTRRPASPLWPPLLVVGLWGLLRSVNANFFFAYGGMLGAFALLRARTAHKVWLQLTGVALTVLCVALFAMEGARVSVINPNLLAALTLITAPFISPVFSVVALVATQSRAAILGAAIAAAAYVGRVTNWHLAIGALVLVIVLSAARWPTVENRFESWGEAARLFAERPVLGWGVGSYPTVNRLHPGGEHADSLPLTILAEQGIIGAGLWAWLIVAIAQHAARSQSNARWGLLALGIQQLADATAIFPFPSLGIGILLSQLELTHETRNVY
jgi:O-antigen ligase